MGLYGELSTTNTIDTIIATNNRTETLVHVDTADVCHLFFSFLFSLFVIVRAVCFFFVK